MFKSEVWDKYIALSNTLISFGKILERAIKENKSPSGLEDLSYIIIQEADALHNAVSLESEIKPAECDK